MSKYKPSDFDAEAMSFMTRYSGGRLFERRSVRENLESPHGDGTWSLDDFIERFIEPAKDATARGRVDVTLEDEYTGLSFRLVRPETDDEMDARIEQAAKYAEEQIASEKETLRRLTDKYAQHGAGG